MIVETPPPSPIHVTFHRSSLSVMMLHFDYIALSPRPQFTVVTKSQPVMQKYPYARAGNFSFFFTSQFDAELKMSLSCNILNLYNLIK